ncbi:hypothetical protein Hte_011202 [Hypoxylon texense]
MSSVISQSPASASDPRAARSDYGIFDAAFLHEEGQVEKSLTAGVQPVSAPHPSSRLRRSAPPSVGQPMMLNTSNFHPNPESQKWQSAWGEEGGGGGGGGGRGDDDNGEDDGEDDGKDGGGNSHGGSDSFGCQFECGVKVDDSVHTQEPYA